MPYSFLWNKFGNLQFSETEAYFCKSIKTHKFEFKVISSDISLKKTFSFMSKINIMIEIFMLFSCSEKLHLFHQIPVLQNYSMDKGRMNIESKLVWSVT